MTKADHKRRLLVADAEMLIAHADQIHYVQQRPMRNEHDTIRGILRRMRHGVDMSMDCSESVSMLFYMAGCKDPNGLDFDGWGNSHQMWLHLTHRYTDPQRAHPGALIVYGSEGSEHVAMVIERNGRNPWLFSHGQEAGPLRISYEAETAAHAGQPATFLDVAALL